jgi:hypothetical protein
MNDFLKNLRSSHKKDAPPPRKNLDGNYYPKTERRIQNERRTTGDSGNFESFAHQLGDVLPEILENTTSLTDQVERMAATNELLAEAEIRQCNAVTDFFKTLNKMISAHPTNFPENSSPKVTTSYASGTHYTKDDILSIIQNMRGQGATFSIIADYLKEKGMPTFSGRGEWHAQTIHRLCK